MRVLILGVTGMLGNVIYRTYHSEALFDTWGTFRSEKALQYFPKPMHKQLISNIDILNQDELINAFEHVRPDIVINCIGLIKQLSCANDPLAVLPINSLFPHRLQRLCSLSGARLIHISTDCVFSGQTGSYVETDLSDARDLYGKSKYVGEISNSPNAVTLRTSIIGHELNSNYALVDWFLAQNDNVKGYIKAIYTGLPTIELARVIRDFVIPNKELMGLHHVAAKPINKFNLLKLIAEIYNKKIIIEPDETIVIDRSLCGHKFEILTGYQAPAWPILIEQMHLSKKLIEVI